jgi:hypothetical protein
MQRYRDLGAEEVEAELLSKQNVKELAAWCNGGVVEEFDPFNPSLKTVGINVPTPDGKKRASEFDVIIRNSQGEFRVLSEWRFLQMYTSI